MLQILLGIRLDLLGARRTADKHNAPVDDRPLRLLRQPLLHHGAFALGFGEGAFTAGTLLPGGGFGALQRHVVGGPEFGTYEFGFRAAELPRFALDLRTPLNDPAAGWLRGPLPFRSVGSGYAPANPEWFFMNVSLPDAFDAVVYLDQTSQTRLLPYDPPTTWEPN